MARFSAETLDLSRLSAPIAIRDIDYETILAERKARLVTLFTAAGISFDVQSIESDPGIILEEADAYRELLTFARVNDAVRSVMVAFATSTDLDHLAAMYGVTRRVIVAASGTTPAVMESDSEFRRRVLLAPEAFAAAGPRGAYVYHALTSHPDVLNVDVWSPAPGEVFVAVQSRLGDGTASEDLLFSVRSYLQRDDIKPLTDVLTVQSVVNVPFDIELDAYVLAGPDPSLIKSEIEAAIIAMTTARRTPARDVPRSAVFAAAQLGSVDKVTLAAPAADIARGYGEVALLNTLTVRVSTYDG